MDLVGYLVKSWQKEGADYDVVVSDETKTMIRFKGTGIATVSGISISPKEFVLDTEDFKGRTLRELLYAAATYLLKKGQEALDPDDDQLDP